jgi:hypothetical protein
MSNVTACKIPDNSLLASFGGVEDYRDCFCRQVSGGVALAEYVERFYSSMAFLPERVILSLIGRGATKANIRALASGEADGIAVWKVVERRDDQILLESKGTGTASWLAVEQSDDAKTKLLFGSWVGRLEQSGWRVMERPHRWYSRMLLAGVRLD